MTRDMLALSFGFAALIAATNIARAEPAPCADHQVVVERLEQGYGETRRAIGLAGDDTVVEIFASDETGTWTIAVTRAGEPTCLVAAGQAFEILADTPAPGDGA